MSFKLSKRSQRLKPSAMFEISSKISRMREAGHDIIAMGIGETDDIDTPLHIKAAAIDAIHDGKTKYTPVDGIPALKQAIAHKLLQENDLEYNPYEIIVSTGAKQCIHNALMCLAEPGDEVIMFAPYWTSYMDNVHYTGATPIVIPSSIDHGFKINPDHLADAITERTRVIILNTPNNPSGVHYTPQELRKIANIIKKHPDIVVISDEIYEHILWSNEPVQNILNIAPKLQDRTIIINGVSKAYAMTGWRIGYAAGPNEIIKQMKNIQSQSTSGTCSIAQHAALEALDGNQRSIEQMTQTFLTRHNLLYNFLNSLEGCKVHPADGTYYLFPEVSGIIQKLGLKNDIELVDYLLEKTGVSVIPGSVFGMTNHLRISFVSSEEKIQQAISRIQSQLTPLDD
ncbi:pyridoxal phosphate-dependent aminotransferase [Candidatus Synchoanobacter obligatus]|uniref:Aminotransferase n=1 Tax=Candidatus Synchoanobacter obligatus TaxID=2919597 RepID=A0ABT1L3X3_9GAMM|nr:pyridoxal phosphate-dependent aminotransferase [Candidatus Synchoanobacter obligatus]MCP8351897.1 pyridoxal phosphate-dependent aminotransferase [Candidatus Synchoanobacter obligatus]